MCVLTDLAVNNQCDSHHLSGTQNWGRSTWSLIASAQRVMRAPALLRRRRMRRRWTTTSQPSWHRVPKLVLDARPCAPNAIWSSAITDVRLGSGFISLAIIMDGFTRAMRGWALSCSLSQDLTRSALQRALTQHAPCIHHSDQGVQYAAPQYVHLLQAAGVQISVAATGAFTQHG